MNTPAVTPATDRESGQPRNTHAPEHRPGPRTGDAIGDMLLAARRTAAHPAAAPVLQIIERDDGFVQSAPVASWIAPIDQWPDEDRQALDLVKGRRVLDIGAGGGRAARALLDRGHDVTALDVSPGALEVCRQRGVQSLAHGTVDEHSGSGARYDNFLLLGANLGLLESRERAPWFLRVLAAMAAPGAVIIGQGHNITDSQAPQHLPYNQRNLRAGRIAGQRTLRIRYRDVTTSWFHYLCLAPHELAVLAAGTGWRLTDTAPSDTATSYIATLTLSA
ncbi:methyltransferase domain-containing protein [Streptomyces sp. NBC_01261]|uniref:methyltransferase domain-containing protein n=1 Tax=Streptomyces sp. NBC_01261 TaxID=2903802 RepID=UPI002E30C345|nr:methyltransferase domain-containing protein [Streptomyces sp. NBC_01261]